MSELRDDEDLQNLFEGLALADRFGFYLVVSPDVATTDAVLSMLPDEVLARRGQPVRTIIINPYRDLPGDTPLHDGLLDLLLWRLTHAHHEDAHGGQRSHEMWIVDASAASARDEEEWHYLFERLNEQRNVIRDGLRGPLLLCLPDAYYRLFAEAAPDFWSIRSGVTFLAHGQALPASSASAPQPPSPRLLVYLNAREDKWLAMELERHLTPLRRAGQISIWSRRNLVSGQGGAAIKKQLARADVVLLLISTEFLADDEMQDLVQLALSQRSRGMLVIPVLLRPTRYYDSAFASLVSLPRDGRPISAADDPDAAWVDVVRGITDVLAAVPKAPAPPVSQRDRREILEALRGLRPASFDALLERLAVPHEARPTPGDRPLSRAVHLLDYMESTGPEGLAQLDRALGDMHLNQAR